MLCNLAARIKEAYPKKAKAFNSELAISIIQIRSLLSPVAREMSEPKSEALKLFSYSCWFSFSRIENVIEDSIELWNKRIAAISSTQGARVLIERKLHRFRAENLFVELNLIESIILRFLRERGE